MTEENERRPGEFFPQGREHPEARDAHNAPWSRPGEDLWSRDRDDPHPPWRPAERTDDDRDFAAAAGGPGPAGGRPVGGPGGPQPPGQPPPGRQPPGPPGPMGGPPPAGGSGWSPSEPTDTLGRPVRERRGMRGATVLVLVLVVGLVTGLAGGAVGGWIGSRAGQEPATDKDYSLGSAPQGVTNRPPDSVAGIAERLLPSVVSVEVPGTGVEGSGFVIKGGYIVTNNHVVAPAADGGEITVSVGDEQSTPATVVGRSPAYDIAVLEPEDTSGLTPAQLGDSDDVVVGDPVVAIGFPARTVRHGHHRHRQRRRPSGQCGR